MRMQHQSERTRAAIQAVSEKLQTVLRSLSRSLPYDNSETREALAQRVMAETKAFLSSFIAANSQGNLTIYRHILQCHVPDMIRRHGSLGQYNMQSTEQKQQMRKKKSFNGKGLLQELDAQGNVVSQKVRGRARTGQSLDAERTRVDARARGKVLLASRLGVRVFEFARQATCSSQAPCTFMPPCSRSRSAAAIG